jgi:hypothetical protein
LEPDEFDGKNFTGGDLGLDGVDSENFNGGDLGLDGVDAEKFIGGDLGLAGIDAENFTGGDPGLAGVDAENFTGGDLGLAGVDADNFIGGDLGLYGVDADNFIGGDLGLYGVDAENFTCDDPCLYEVDAGDLSGCELGREEVDGAAEHCTGGKLGLDLELALGLGGLGLVPILVLDGPATMVHGATGDLAVGNLECGGSRGSGNLNVAHRCQWRRLPWTRRSGHLGTPRHRSSLPFWGTARPPCGGARG